MDIWINTCVYDGQVETVSTHLTRRGALVGQIVDILAWLGDTMMKSKESWRKTLDNEWHCSADCEYSEQILFREDVMSWREWSIDDQWNLRDALLNVVHNTGTQAEWYFEHTQVQP